MKHKTAELEGRYLDWAVALAFGVGKVALIRPSGEPFEPSSNWAHGGPIIELEQISLWKGRWEGATARGMPEGWIAYIDADAVAYNGEARTEGRVTGNGPTPLIAAMRAFVVSKLGDEAELP